MSTTDNSTTTLVVGHHERVSNHSFEEVIAKLNRATGSVEDGFASYVTSNEDREQFEDAVHQQEGSSGFMRFIVLDHGAWLGRFYGRPAKAALIILGNPLIAITMLQHDLRAGLNVPTRLFIEERSEAGTRISFDLPSTLMGNLTEEAQVAARRLDVKLLALVDRIV